MTLTGSPTSLLQFTQNQIHHDHTHVGRSTNILNPSIGTPPPNPNRPPLKPKAMVPKITTLPKPPPLAPETKVLKRDYCYQNVPN